MTQPLTADWFREFASELEDDESFTTEMRHFDGSVRLDVGDDTVWMKIYRGQILEVLAEEAEFGSTFAISGPAEEWERLLTQERNPFGEQQTLGLLQFSGNVLESTRMVDGINAMVRVLRAQTDDEVALTAGGDA
ncbi:hypothetical protein [Halorubellus salinus]|uniref:hypothetical protein n=1 Tax=Halorubellus salinus TaxID=755309 RepID=UPI001D05DB07|nr:hypothetical protein [Halorubellus salinus]